MTNSEKIKAYLDAGHKVKVDYDDNKTFIAYFAREVCFVGKQLDTWIDDIRWFMSLDNQMWIKISIHQEPLRYPKVGDKVVNVRN